MNHEIIICLTIFHFKQNALIALPKVLLTVKTFLHCSFQSCSRQRLWCCGCPLLGGDCITYRTFSKLGPRCVFPSQPMKPQVNAQEQKTLKQEQKPQALRQLFIKLDCVLRSFQTSAHVYHFHLIMNCYYTYPTLWLNGLGNTQLMIDSLGHIVTWWPVVIHSVSINNKPRAISK